MTTDERLSFANHLGDKSYVEGHWQIVVENACRLLEEYEGIEFGLNCVRRVLDSWTLFVPDDDRVRNALTAVENWLKGEKNVELLKHVSLAASDAAVDVDDPEEVPKIKSVREHFMQRVLLRVSRTLLDQHANQLKSEHLGQKQSQCLWDTPRVSRSQLAPIRLKITNGN